MFLESSKKLLRLGLILAPVCVGAQKCTATDQSQSDEEKCAHGCPNIVVLGGLRQADQHHPCDCFTAEGWKVAGPTDLANFFDGRCTQYMCSKGAADTCKSKTGISEAYCLENGWNCWCPWEYADYFFNGRDFPEAKCMGMMYWMSVKLVGFAGYVLASIPLYVGLWALFFLPFGERKFRCTCREPERFRVLNVIWRIITGKSFPNWLAAQDCDGSCVNSSPGFVGSIYYNFAWSLYVIDIGIWIYVFFAALLVTGLMMASIVGVIILALIAICVLIALMIACIGALCGDNNGGGGGDCDCFGGDCNAECFGSQGCDACCNPWGPAGLSDPSYFIFGGPQPGDCSGCNGDNCCNCECCPRWFLCRPIVWTLIHFPFHPRNLWGGVFGMLMGTHESCVSYTGGSRCKDFFRLDWLRGQDLHDNDQWRSQLSAFIFEEPALETAIPTQAQMQPAEVRRRPNRPQAHYQRPSTLHGVSISSRDNHFTESDHCQRSSFEDYKNGTCWICCSDESANWDLWAQCGHLFCEYCSNAMLQKRMPCALCRRVSTNIIRAPKYPHDSGNSGNLEEPLLR